MAYQIIQQPDRTFAIWSTIVDDFVLTGGTDKEILEFFLEEEKERVTGRVKGIIEALKNGEKPYFQFTLTWERALALCKEVNGEK